MRPRACPLPSHLVRVVRGCVPIVPINLAPITIILRTVFARTRRVVVQEIRWQVRCIRVVLHSVA